MRTDPVPRPGKRHGCAGGLGPDDQTGHLRHRRRHDEERGDRREEPDFDGVVASHAPPDQAMSEGRRHRHTEEDVPTRRLRREMRAGRDERNQHQHRRHR